MKRILYLPGQLTVESIQETLEKLGADPKEYILLFAGDYDDQHGVLDTQLKSSLLFASKNVSGNMGHFLVKPYSEKGYPTLSLPLDFPEKLDTHKRNAITENAIADLYRVAGGDFSFILPVRPYAFATAPLAVSSFEHYEPSFGRPHELTREPYNRLVAELKDLHSFLALSHEEQIAKAETEKSDNYRMSAFLEGIEKKSYLSVTLIEEKKNKKADYMRQHYGKASGSASQITLGLDNSSKELQRSKTTQNQSNNEVEHESSKQSTCIIN